MRRITLQDFQGSNEANARGSDLAELMEQFGAARQLPGSDEHVLPHGRDMPPGVYASTRSKLAFRSRLLRMPMTWSATWPFLKNKSVGIELMP